MSALDELVKKHKPVCASLQDFSLKCNCGADRAAEELAALRAQLAEAEEVITAIDAIAHRGDVDNVKSLAYEYVNKYEVEA